VPYAVFDIETRVDKALVNAVLHRRAALTDEEAYARTRAELTDRGGGFFPLAFHVPVSIAVGEVDDARVLRRLDVLGARDYDEARLVTEFWERVEAFPGTLVSFNGRGFDLPVLELAALRHALRLPRYFARREHEPDALHYDVYDLLTDGGRVPLRGGFHLLARLSGLPGKGAVDGAAVQELWEAGRRDEVHAYCRRDVIQTYVLFLRLELLRGRITHGQYAAALDATATFRAEL
jgi:predicted PolB exonuclease-like 3'-5' exonuclease